MIHFVATRSHTNTVRNLLPLPDRAVGTVWSYESLFQRKAVPAGTWVFTDHERLSVFERTLAAAVAATIEAAGSRVLNHPARVLTRYEMLKALSDAGLNSFSAWRADGHPEPRSFPVFIRNEFDHRSDTLQLIDDQASLDRVLHEMEAKGVPLFGKIVIEYAGAEVYPGLWQRYATYTVGGRVIPHHSAFDFQWVAKDPKNPLDVWNHPYWPTFVEIERNFILGRQYQDVLQQAFALAKIDYGRADFGIVDGKVEIYEINTNPFHAPARELGRGTHPDQIVAQKHSEDELRHTIASLDSHVKGLSIPLEDPMLKRQQAFRLRFHRPIRRP